MVLLVPYTILAQGIYSGIIGTISAITMGTISVIKTVYTHQNPDANRLMKKLDIERRLRLIQSVLDTIDMDTKNENEDIELDQLEKTQILEMVKTHNNIAEKINIDTDPIELCLRFIKETVLQITNILSDMNNKINRHHQKWFYSWRTLDISTYLENLEIESKLLDARFNDLATISTYLARRKDTKTGKSDKVMKKVEYIKDV